MFCYFLNLLDILKFVLEGWSYFVSLVSRVVKLVILPQTQFIDYKVELLNFKVKEI